MFKWLQKKKRKKALREAKRHLESLSTFFPNSENYWAYPDLTYSAANNLPKQLSSLISKTTAIENYTNLEQDKKLSELFEKYGSDKHRNGYSPIYSEVLKKIGKEELFLLEIGLGTNNPEMISSMGIKGKPGASLRAFRDYLPYGQICGADIDKDILFSDDRIETRWVDQTNLMTLKELPASFGNPSFDLVIDDGLHSSEANLNTLLFWMDSAPQGGWLVIEDIPERTLDVWRIVAFILGETGYDVTIYRAVAGYIVVVQKT